MFDDVLIESAGRDKQKGGWITALVSGVLHVAIIGGIIAAGYYVKQNPQIIEKPIHAFVVSQAAPPPPPPPPPPPAAHASSTPKTPHVVKKTPIITPHNTFHQPTQTPKEVPQVEPVESDSAADTKPSTDTADDTGGVVGGVEGGVKGGVVGGEKGGVIGGVIGGVVGGTLGGTLGGKLGGELGGTGDKPMRVGGDVSAPIAIKRVDPVYTEVARSARIEGVVIIEAIIDTDGRVTDARVLKSLGMGLDDSALEAVKRWRFKPGRLNGQPVPVIYNLTVNFRLQ